MSAFTWNEVHGLRLVRNYLLRPAPCAEIAQVVSAVCGIQAQIMVAAELALSARVADVTQEDVRKELWERKSFVKTYGPRGTLHLLPADELTLWMAAMRARDALDETPWYAPLNLTPRRAQAFVEAIGEALNGRCLTRAELANKVGRSVGAWAKEGIASAWGDPASAQAAFKGLLCFGPSQGSKVTFVRADQWIGQWKELDPDESLNGILRCYLAAYGPATYQDFAQWFALKPGAARSLFQSLGAELEEVEVEGKRAWTLAHDNEVRIKSSQHSLRLLPQYDCYILGARLGRERIVPGSARARIFAYGRGRYEGAVGVPVLLVDGLVAGMWERRKRGRFIEVRVEAFKKLTPVQQRQLKAEAERVGKFLGAKVELSQGMLG